MAASWLLPLLVVAASSVVAAVVVLFGAAWQKARRNPRRAAAAFFHPYTNDGGGGERVLWCAVKAVQEERPDLRCVVYTGDRDATPEGLEARALDRFGVRLLAPPEVEFDARFFLLFVHVHLSFVRFHDQTIFGRDFSD